jgi:hypothetical protein
MQNLVVWGEYSCAALLHDSQDGESGRMYWYATSDDRRTWEYSVNVRRDGSWWWLECGTLISGVEMADDPALHGSAFWDNIRAGR